MTAPILHDILARTLELRQTLQDLGQQYAQARSEAESIARRWREDHQQERKQQLARLHQQQESLQAEQGQAREQLEARYEQQLQALTASYRQQRQEQWGRGTVSDDPQTEEQLGAQATAKATTRYNAFRRSCDELDKRLQALEQRLSPLTQPITATAISLPRKLDPEGHAEDLQDLTEDLARRLSPLCSLGTRLRHAVITHIVVQGFLLAIAAAVAWQVWSSQQEPMAPLIVGVVWLVLALIVLAVRETAAAQRRKALGMLLGECGALRQALRALRKRGSTMLDPQKELAMALEALDRHQTKRQQAAEEAAAKEEQQRLQARREREQRQEALLREREQARQALVQEQAQAAESIQHSIRDLEQALEGTGSCPELDALLEPQRRIEHETMAHRDTALREMQELCARASSAPMIDPNKLADPPGEMPEMLPMGSCDSDSTQLLRQEGWLHTPEQSQALQLPLALPWGQAPALLIRGSNAQARPLLHAAMLQVMASLPAGMVRFTLCDPQHLGESFAPFLALCDQHSQLIGPKVWTSSGEIDQRLQDLSEHGEKVIQKYLRDRHHSLDDYNRHAGDLAEPYHVLIISDIPRSCSAAALERLHNIVHFGPRCGISVWLHCPGELPTGLSAEALRSNGLIVDMRGDVPIIDHPAVADWQWHAPNYPAADVLRHAVTTIAAWQQQLSDRAIPLEHCFPAAGKEWGEDSRTGLRIAIGRSGAEAFQYLELGRGTAQHVLIGGRTGSGKSTLLHALIVSGALYYAPSQLHLYLVDFKKGVEFKAYARHSLPHAQVVAVESDREYGLSVLRTLDEELDRRGQLFRGHDVQDLAGFRVTCPDQEMPRIALVIDEFHEFFVEDDAIARDAAVLLERFVRQGRAFGMHIILGSQSISGSMSLARSAIGQIGVRIALQCNEADSQLILSEDNPAARLLDRPGEAIYNGSAGQAAANSPFQVFWLDDAVREQTLKRLRALAPDAPPPWSFEGNVPALLTHNHTLQQHLAQPASAQQGQLRGWLGEPNAIKGPCELFLQQRSGANCLVVGQHRPGVYGALAGLLASLAAQHPQITIHCVDGERGDERGIARLQQLASSLGLDMRMVSPGDSAALISTCAEGLSSDSPARQDHLIILLGLNRLRALRQEDAFAFNAEPDTPGQHLGTCLEHGPEHGTHIIAWCESAQQVGQCLNRSTLRWFNHRLLFQMNAGDSTDLIDDSSASRLGLHHALLCDLDSMAREKFRPYAALDDGQLAELAAWRQQ